MKKQFREIMIDKIIEHLNCSYICLVHRDNKVKLNDLIDELYEQYESGIQIDKTILKEEFNKYFKLN